MSYHGLIPEAVYATTSASILRNKTFETALGNFYYERLPTKNFFVGVDYVEQGKNLFLMATPWKALLDYIFCHKENWNDFSPVEESLRIEPEELPKIERTQLENFKKYYHSRRMNIFIDAIPGEFIT